jgi:hypothetical protein
MGCPLAMILSRTNVGFEFQMLNIIWASIHVQINYIERLSLGMSIEVLLKMDVGFFLFFKNTNNVHFKIEKLNNMELHHKIQMDYIVCMNKFK